MASKSAADKDRLKVSVVVDLVVSEKEWLQLMKANGKDMTGVVVPAHVSHAARKILKREFERIGFPQPQIRAIA